MTAVCHKSDPNASTNSAWIQGNHAYNSHRDLRRPGPLRPAPVDAFQEHRQLRATQANGPFSSLRPDESPSLQTLRKQTKSVAVEPQQLDDVTAASTENEDVTGKRLLVEHCLHLRTQAVETTTHVGHAGSDPYPRSGAELDHLRRLSRIDRNNTGSAPHSTLIITRPGNSM